MLIRGWLNDGVQMRVFAITLLLLVATHADIRHIWAVNDAEKVEPDARDHPGRARNSAWVARIELAAV